MPERTWADVRAAVLQAVQIASRLPETGANNRTQCVQWDEDPKGYRGEPHIRLTITSTRHDGQRRLVSAVPSTDPGFTDLEVGVSGTPEFVVTATVQTVRQARALDALHYAETIRMWMHDSPAVKAALRAQGVVYVGPLSLAPLPDRKSEDRVTKVWALDLEFRCEVYLASTERLTTIDRVGVTGSVDTGNETLDIDVEVEDPN